MPDYDDLLHGCDVLQEYLDGNNPSGVQACLRIFSDDLRGFRCFVLIQHINQARSEAIPPAPAFIRSELERLRDG